MRTLIIEAHGDDAILGVGGYISRAKSSNIEIKVLTFGGERGNPRHHNIGSENLSDLANTISEAINKFHPDTVMTHYEHDVHQDHRQLFLATMIACRPIRCNVERLLSYEVPTVAQIHQFEPNVFISLYETDIQEKWKMLNSMFKSEIKRNKELSYESLSSLARVRGYQSGCEFAEGLKLIWSKE